MNLGRYFIGSLAAMLLVAAAVRLTWELIHPALIPLGVLLVLGSIFYRLLGTGR